MKLSVNQIKNTEKDLISFGVTKLHVIFAHDMRKHLFIIIMALCCIQMQAQENVVSDLEKPADTPVPASQHQTPTTQSYALSPSEVEIEQPSPATYHPSPISLPWMGWSRGYGAFMGNLHPGFNVSLGASVFAPIGKHRYGGAGFSQDITAVYAMPLTNRLSLAVGGYFNNITWGHHSYRDAGVNAILGYRFNEHWEAFIYGQKSFLKPEMPLPLYYMHDVGDRIGAAVRYTPNHTFSVTVSVEGRSEPSWLPAMPFANRYNDFPYDGMDW